MNLNINDAQAHLADNIKKLVALELQSCPKAIYKFILMRAEVPLFEAMLSHTRGNQTKAAEILGINRGTFRKKLRQYRLIEENNHMYSDPYLEPKEKSQNSEKQD